MNIRLLISRFLTVGLVGAFLFVQAPFVQSASISGDGFNPVVNATVYTQVVQSNGKILVGGDFSTVGGTPRSFIARINPDGSLGTGFNPGANGSVRALAVQPDGKILVAGNFTLLGACTCNRIGRLNSDGSLDTVFNTNIGPGANGMIHAMVLQPDGKILIGGEFSTLGDPLTIGGNARTRIGRLNPDGTLDDSFNPGANGPVYSLALQLNRMILVGGSFTNLGGVNRNNIGRLDKDGVLDSFNPNASGVVNALTVQPDGKVLVGGDFTAVGGGTRPRIERLLANGNYDSGFAAPGSGANGEVRVLTIQSDGKILVGGDFTSLVGGSRTRVDRLNQDGTLDSSFDTVSAGTNGTVRALTIQSDNKILVGGAFTSLAGTSRNNVGRLYLDGSLDKDLTAGTNNVVHAIAIQPDGKIIIGGTFTTLGAAAHNLIGRLNQDGTVDSSFNPTLATGGTVWAVAVQPDGYILIAGSFTAVDGVSHKNIGRLLPNGDWDSSFTAFASSEILCMALQPDGKILVGGKFSSLNGVGNPRLKIGRLNTNGSLDTFNPGASDPGGTAEVRALAVQSNGQILVGGSFTQLAGTSRSNIGRLNADGSLDDNFNPGASAIVYTFAVQGDGRILVGGDFTTLGGSTRNHIGRLYANGTLDTSFNPGANLTVYSMALQPNGKLLAGGTFTFLGGGSRNNIGRLNTDGSLDSSFNPGANNTVDALALQPDGKILGGGAFSSLGYSSRNYFARLSNDTAALQYLTTDNTTDTITWHRSGAGPEPSYVTFEQSPTGAPDSYSLLASPVRIADGWQLTGQSLSSGTLYIRARGYSPSGDQNGSSSMIESIRNMYIDNSIPRVKSIVMADSNPTNAAIVAFTVTFSESVSSVEQSDFIPITSGLSGVSVSGLSGSGDTYTVSVNTGTGSGTLRLDLLNRSTILNGGGNTLTGDFTSGETYTIDRTAPTVASILRTGSNPSLASPVVFKVTFSEDVQGAGVDGALQTSDFSTSPSSGVTGASVTGVAPLSSLDKQSYLVTVGYSGGTGFLGLGVNPGSIHDIATNSLAGGFTGGEAFTIGNVPFVSSSVKQIGSTDPTNAASVYFTVTFSKSVSGVTTNDFALTVSGLSGASVTSVSAGPAITYTVTVSTGTGFGTLRLDVLNNHTITDGTNFLVGDTFTAGEYFTIDKTVPTVSSLVRNDPTPTNASTVSFTVTFSEVVTGVDTGDFNLSTSGLSGSPGITSVTGSGATYVITASTGTGGSGPIGLNVKNNPSIYDAFSNQFAGGYTGTDTYLVDHVAPSVSSIICASPNPTNADSVDFTVMFSEPVTGVDTSDFAFTTTGFLSGLSITSISGTGATRTVTVNTGTGTGTLRLDLVNDQTVVDGATNPLNAGYTGGQIYSIFEGAFYQIYLPLISR